MSLPKIIVRCVECGARLAAPASRAGRVLRCPKCDTLMKVPERSPAAPARVAPAAPPARDAVPDRPEPPAPSSSARAEAFQPTRIVGFLSGVAQRSLDAVKGHLEQRAGLRSFQEHLVAYLADGVLSEAEKRSLAQLCAHTELPWEEALAASQEEIAFFLHSVLADIVADGVVTPEEEEVLRDYVAFLDPGVELQAELHTTIRRVKAIQEVRRGAVEQVEAPELTLGPDEVAWARMSARRVVETPQGPRVDPGIVFVTSLRLVFLCRTRPFALELEEIHGAEGTPSHFYVTRRAAGDPHELAVRDGELLQAYVEQALGRLEQRKQRAREAAAQAARARPRPVRAAMSLQLKQQVWLRDRGRCVACAGTQYLEFDAAVPIARGGRYCLENVRLLCRNCNLKYVLELEEQGGV